MKNQFSMAVKRRTSRQLLLWWILPLAVIAGWRYSVCPIQITRWQYRPENGTPVIIPEWDCLKCRLCIEICPQKALAFKTD